MTEYYGCMIPIDLDINMLRCFMEVAGTGSFTKAGKNIGLTQSGVSIKIKRLEDRLGLQVFNRAGRQLTLTFEGEILYDYAARILSAHDEAVIRLTSPKASGNLRVGILDYFIPEILPGLLGKFRKHYPNIHLEVRTDFGMNLVPLFENGELDLVVTGQDSFYGKSRVLTKEPLVWVTGRDYEIKPETDPVNLVLLPSPCVFRKIATESLDKMGLKWEILFTGTSIANIQAAVEAGIGLSILPKGALKEGMKKAPSSLNLPELPVYSIVSIIDESKKNSARDVFSSYLEAELNNLS